MQEVWKDISSFEGKYQVSNYGNVRSLNYHREKRIKNLNQRNRNGYNVVTFNGISHKTFMVHRLVLCTFENKPLDYHLQVNHIDGNKRNNMIENLEFVTQKENVRHAFDIGLRTIRRGCQIKNSILTETQVIEIKNLLKDGNMMQKDIAIMYGVHKATINDIHKEKNWKHITI